MSTSSPDSDDEEVIVQDIQRELLLANLLRLRHMKGRHGHDAEDEEGNPIELKTTTKDGFGTGRDVSLAMITEWKTRYWVCAKGRNLRSGFKIEEVYFLSPKMLQGWFGKMEKKFGPDIILREKMVSEVRNILSKEELQRLEYLVNRGMTYNNPHVGLSYVRKNGVRIGLQSPAKDLKALIVANPLGVN